MENNAPNIDAMSADECFAFWATYQRGRNYKTLFPQGGKGTRRAAADLANYASNFGAAIQCRLRGAIQTAQMYQDIADRIYQDLPDFARW